MDELAYNHVRVLNLSDICQPSMELLIQQLNAGEGTGDSVFASLDRAEELAGRLNGYDGRVVAAWSYSSARVLTNRGREAYRAVVRRQLNVIGVDGRFGHPSRSATWAVDLVENLAGGR
ncbi:MAG: hypothetical protein F4Y86_02815 [Gammaproteobacteria bacterium]|nr:hypothetical protein [Gammaproteobacteria bacterium]MYB39178.1 hypothetical protein [Gammaproteobacteria bacterium]